MGDLDETERRELHRIVEALKNVHAAELTALPANIGEALRWLVN